ncbi:ATP-dependent helicase [bacterium]|nr:ATP-dependent helicase [bacterium]
MNSRFFPTLDYSKELNSEQLQIVKEAEGPCLVLAGAGSGKTRVLVYRVCYLIEQGIPPASIMLVTFTNRAANEMIHRIEELTDFYPNNLCAGTFHRVGNSFLRRYSQYLNMPANYIIIDEADSISIIKDIVSRYPNKDKLPKPAKIKSILSFSTNTCVDLRKIIGSREFKYISLASQLESIFTEYKKRKREANLLDFDDILLFWYALMKDENIGRDISEKFRYILVDEYHDTNTLQSKILYQLTKINQNITVVGDDAQSIYSFRGATIENILKFPEKYPNAKTFYLYTNYRSTPQILHLSNKIIAKNKFQYEKHLKSTKQSGIKPLIVQCYAAEDEAMFVSNKIAELIKSGVPPSEIGVLFRSRYQAAKLEIDMNRIKTPYIIRGGLRFFEQAHIKDVIAYLRLVENFKDTVAWKRIFALTQGVGPKTSETLLDIIDNSKSLNDFSDKISSKNLSPKIRNNVTDILKLLNKLGTSEISVAIDYIMKEKYFEYLEKQYDEFIEREEDIEMLKSISKSYGNLSDFLAEASLQEHSKGENTSINMPVILSTIHQAKGLEWKVVFIIGVSQNHFPYSYKYATEDFEEERRVFYVATTRAKE